MDALRIRNTRVLCESPPHPVTTKASATMPEARTGSMDRTVRVRSGRSGHTGAPAHAARHIAPVRLRGERVRAARGAAVARRTDRRDRLDARPDLRRRDLE